MSDRDLDLANLDRAGRAAGQVAARSGWVAWIALVAAIILAWLTLIALSLRAAQTRPPGGDIAGDGLLGAVPAVPLPAFFEFLLALCLTPIQARIDRPGSSSCRGGDVVSDGGGDDAALRRADAQDLLRDRRHGRRERASRRFTRWFLSPGISRPGLPRRPRSPRSTWRSARFTRSAPLAPAEPYLAAALLTIAGLYQFSALQGGLPEEVPDAVSRSCSRAGARGRPRSSGLAWTKASGASAAAGR